MENHYIVQTVVIDGDLSKCVQPVYPAGWEENHDKYDFNNPMWAMLSDMDDPYQLGLFIKKFDVQPGQINVKDISAQCDYNPSPTVWVSVEVEQLNQWSNDMKLFWVTDYHPEISIKTKTSYGFMRTQTADAESYQVPMDELLATFG